LSLAEQKQRQRGLGRSVLLEALLFVPTSVLLVLLTVAPFLVIGFTGTISAVGELPFYGLLGLASYGFPFAAVRRLVTKAALNTLREFAAIAHKESVET